MAAPPRRQIVLLAVLTVVLAVLVVVVLLPSLPWRASGAAGPAAPGPAAGVTRAAASAPPVEVRLGLLEAAVEDPSDSGRNPFRMGAAQRAEPAGPAANAAPALPPPQMTGPPPPPPVPAIPFRFIGVLSGPSGVGRIAVLSDGTRVVHGRENEIVEGRYRIVKIGEESIQLEHLDGRGRQTIRLSGS